MSDGDANSHQEAILRLDDLTECSVGDLTPEGHYQFRLRAGNQMGDGPWGYPTVITPTPSKSDYILQVNWLINSNIIMGYYHSDASSKSDTAF